MYFKPLLLPLLAQVALTFLVTLVMYRRRINEMKKRRIDPQRLDNRKNSRDLLDSSATSADNFSNQFEAPVLFYVAVIITLMLMLQDSVIVFLAWLYVLFRYVHSFIHITYNHVYHRFMAYILSTLVLFALWFRLAWIIFQS